MAKFCGQCGSPLDPKTGNCPHCHPPATKPSSAKKRHTGRTLIIILAIVAVIAAGTILFCQWVNISLINIVLNAFDHTQSNPSSLSTPTSSSDSTSATSTQPTVPYEVSSPDADTYFQNHATVVTTIDPLQSPDVHTEAQAYREFRDRGFTQNAITAEYMMDGTYYSASTISSSSSAKHPTYQTHYMTASGEIWTIMEINGTMMAIPVSYRLSSGTSNEIVFSETNTLTSYDGTSNRFFITIPHETDVLVRTVSHIDAATLEQLTTAVINGTEVTTP